MSWFSVSVLLNFNSGLFDIQQQDKDVTVAVESSNKLLQGEE